MHGAAVQGPEAAIRRFGRKVAPGFPVAHGWRLLLGKAMQRRATATCEQASDVLITEGVRVGGDR